MFVKDTKTNLILYSNYWIIFMSRKIMHVYTFKAPDGYSPIKFVTSIIEDIPSILAKSVNHSSTGGHQDRHEDVPQKWRLANEMLKHGEREKCNLRVKFNKLWRLANEMLKHGE